MAVTAFKQITDNAVSTSATSFVNTGVTSIALVPGDGAKFPVPGNGFYVTLWNGIGVGADPNSEKVLVTANSGDVLTCTATTKLHTSPCNVALLDVIQNTLDMQHAINALESGGGGSAAGALAATTPTTSWTANGTVVVNSRNSVDATSGNITMTLPTGTALGQTVFVQKSDSGSNIVYLSGTINGGVTSTFPLRLQLQGKLLQWDGASSWNTVAGDLGLPSLDSRYAAIGTGGGSGTGAYDLSTFGGKVDGKLYNAFTTTSGSTTVTLSGGAFVSGDVGKVIILHRSGTSNAELVTTIATVVSSTSITVATAPSISASGVMGVYGTDDTAAYQAAITSINSNVTGGNAIVTIAAGFSILNGAQVSGTSGGGTYSGQVLFPSRNHSLPIQSFVFKGASTQSGPDTSGPQASTQQYPPNNGTILVSTATTGSVFDAIPATSGSLAGTFTFVNTVFQDLILRCLPATNANGLNLSKCNSAQVKSVIVDTFCGVTDTLAWGTTGAGIYCPLINNSANVLIENTWVSGFYYGVRHSECTHFDNLSIYLCYVGIGIEMGYHDATYARTTLSQNVINVQVNSSITGSQPVTPIRGFIDIEHARTGYSYTNTYDFDDVNNRLKGHVWVHLVQGAVGVAYDFRLNGAIYLAIVQEYNSIGAGELIGQTVYNPGTATSVTSTGTLTAVDATNAIVTFIAPPSRNVLVEVSTLVTTSGSAQLNIGLLESSTAVGSQSQMLATATGTGTLSTRTTGHIYVSGVSAASHTYKLAIIGSGTSNISYGGVSGLAGYGPLIIKVIAA